MAASNSSSLVSTYERVDGLIVLCNRAVNANGLLTDKLLAIKTRQNLIVR